jgi:hypothetical protein
LSIPFGAFSEFSKKFHLGDWEQNGFIYNLMDALLLESQVHEETQDFILSLPAW